jgi:hypothetical protein
MAAKKSANVHVFFTAALYFFKRGDLSLNHPFLIEEVS